MRCAMIGTWDFSLGGIVQGRELLQAGASAADAVERAVCVVEDDETAEYVGYGGLPNIEGLVELDAAYMDGDSLLFGAAISVQNVRNPIRVARALSAHRVNCQLAGKGAEQFAQEEGFEFRNMLTAPAKAKWVEQMKKGPENPPVPSGHDTVGIVALDQGGHMGVGVSTSGLFMKHPGRVGDSPIMGSGFYCDSQVGGAAATGIGEDIMRGCLCFEIVRLMRDGQTPLAACNSAMRAHEQRLRTLGYTIEPMSVVALSRDGELGAASTKEVFDFTAFTDDGPATNYVAVREGDKTELRQAE